MKDPGYTPVNNRKKTTTPANGSRADQASRSPNWRDWALLSVFVQQRGLAGSRRKPIPAPTLWRGYSHVAKTDAVTQHLAMRIEKQQSFACGQQVHPHNQIIVAGLHVDRDFQ